LKNVPFCHSPESATYGEILFENNTFVSTSNWILAWENLILFEGSMNFTMIKNYFSYYQKSAELGLVRVSPGFTGGCMPGGVFSIINITNNTFTVPEIPNINYEGYANIVLPLAFNWRVDFFFENNLFKDYPKSM